MSKLHYKESPTPAQKSAFKNYLSEDEELILVAGLGKAYLRSQFIMYLLWPGIIGGVLGLSLGWLLKLGLPFLLAVALPLMIFAAALKTLHLHHANRYLLTTRRVIIKKGFFSVKLTAALYDKITHIEVDQSFFDRLLFHHGNIIINTAGLNKGEITLSFIDYPMEFKNLLERLINREREQFGLKSTPLVSMEGEIVG